MIDDVSVCYRGAREATHPADPLETYVPSNPHQITSDWSFRGIDHVLVRCDDAGPTLVIANCRRVFDHGSATRATTTG